MMPNKSVTIRVRFVDLRNNPFANLYHEIRVSGDKYAISAGHSNREGLGVHISRPVGTQLDILVKHPITKKMVKANHKVTITVPKNKGVFRVQAPFYIETTTLRSNSEEGGNYSRKTYKVKAGDNLSSIAKYFNTTWQLLYNLNKDKIKADYTIYPGQWLKIPPENSGLRGVSNNQSSQPSAKDSYTLKKGDTLWGISQETGGSIDELKRINNISDPKTLRIGQTIKLKSKITTSKGVLKKPPIGRLPSANSNQSSNEEDGLLDKMVDLFETVSENFEALNKAVSGPKEGESASSPPPFSNNSPATSKSGVYKVKPGDSLIKVGNIHGVSASDIAQANGIDYDSIIYVGQVLKMPNGSGSASSRPSASSTSSSPTSPVQTSQNDTNSQDGTPKTILTTDGSCVCKTYDLIWGAKVSCEFRKKVIEISQDLWPDDYLNMANNLMAVFAWESNGTFKSDAPNIANSGGTGLIQFMPDTYRSLTGREPQIEIVNNYWSKGKDLKRVKQLAQMTELEQLDIVKEFFEPKRGQKLEFIDFYLQVLFPASSGKPEHVVFSNDIRELDRTNESDRVKKLRVRAYKQNKIDPNNDGKVMKSEIADAVNHYLTDGIKHRNITPSCSQGVHPPKRTTNNLELNPLACGANKHYERTLKNIEALHPIMRPYVIKLINDGYRETGITWVITDGYRSPNAQNQLSSSVTSAKALQSYHQYGLAIDIVSVTNGEITYLTNNALSIKNSKKPGPIGQELGLKWGGVWKKVDYPHFQLEPNGKTWRDLKPQLLKIGVQNYKNLVF